MHVATKDQIIEILKTVYDPEIQCDIWSLGLVYNIEIEGSKVKILMTFTTPMCPYGPMLVEEIKAKVSEINGVKEVDVDVVFDPPWQPSEQLRATLGV